MIELTNEEKTGLQIVALIRTGVLSMFNCSTCTVEMQNSRNCSGDDLDKAVYYHPAIGEFYACPVKFIPSSIYSFIDQYDYHEKYPSSAPSYDEVNPRYWASVKFYENFIHELQNTKTEQKSDPEDNKSKMASLFKKQKE